MPTAIPTVVRLLSSPEDLVRLQAARAVTGLAMDGANAAAIIGAGAVPVLFCMCRCVLVGTDPRLCMMAEMALGNLGIMPMLPA